MRVWLELRRHPFSNYTKDFLKVGNAALRGGASSINREGVEPLSIKPFAWHIQNLYVQT